MAWIRASASMPMVSRIVRLDGHELLDGGIADSIPLRFFESIGYERNIVVLTQPQGFIKEKNRYLPLLRVALRKYPKAFRALAQRHEEYNEAVRYVRRAKRKGLRLCFARTNRCISARWSAMPAGLRAVYEAGRAVAGAVCRRCRRFWRLRTASDACHTLAGKQGAGRTGLPPANACGRKR